MSNRDWDYVGALVYSALYWMAIIGTGLAWGLHVVVVIAIAGVGSAFLQHAVASAGWYMVQGALWMLSNVIAIAALVALILSL